ncbi:ATP-dependent DNA helicase RecG [Candidatus Weimeria sp. HCP3S3_B5]|uniref:ATP-dependent DNA helicase RecG n=1 Tax=Candidatus Weimeria sp. HCP3S3_B5 TaxID=3438871 RepID=UPI003F8AED8A
MKIFDDITAVKGIGEKTAALFKRAGVFCVYDLLTYYPATYMTYPEISDQILLSDKTMVSVCCPIRRLSERYVNRKLITVAAASVGGDDISLVWFNQRYLKRTLKPGYRYVFYGKLSCRAGSIELLSPQIFSREEYGRLSNRMLPVYSKVLGLNDKTIRKALVNAFTEIEISEYLPDHILNEYGLMDLSSSLHDIHFPKSKEQLALARRRLVFDEFFLFLLQQRLVRLNERKIKNPLQGLDLSVSEKIEEALPYKLTGGQKEAISDVITDLTGPTVSQRLIQGDVGCGKTIVAFIAMAIIASGGYEAALMAPTEVLARQHYNKLASLTREAGLDIRPVLLTGSVKGKARKEALSVIEDGGPVIVIGTHALFQEKVVFNKLALVITDEQHRFGVKQREALSKKGQAVFSIVMSATPIPRTLSLILYQGMSVSSIKEKPSLRLPLKNALINAGQRDSAYSFIVKQIRAGHQAIIICPLVEASENIEGENVCDYADRMSSLLPNDIRLGRLTGPMAPDEKDKVMGDFASGRIDLLIATTVIEVGVDVPNATVIMIEDAQRFGLAQLHQLRGRVGRGDAQGYCILVDSSGSKTPPARLKALLQSNDGFYLADADLRLRGPGDTFGVRQSGEASFRLGDIYKDADILKEASRALSLLTEDGADLSSYPNLSERLDISRNRTFINL